MYDDIEVAAAKAEEEFKQQQWKWSVPGTITTSTLAGMDLGEQYVPSREEILKVLRELRELSKEGSEDFAQGGRLVYYKKQFGHQVSD